LVLRGYLENPAQTLFSLTPVPDTSLFSKGMGIFYVSKYIELLDTLFIHLKGNAVKQYSFLHVYHHSTILFVVHYSYYNLRQSDYLAVGMNSAIHTLMYGYYFVSIYYKNLPKKWMTILQMSQFVITIVHCVIGIYLEGMAATTAWIHLIYQSSLLVLFHHFYRRTFTKQYDQQDDQVRTNQNRPYTPRLHLNVDTEEKNAPVMRTKGLKYQAQTLSLTHPTYVKTIG